MSTRFFPRYKANLITSRFGLRTHPVTKKPSTMHNGIDMTATNDGKTGQTDYITAHTGGTVESVGYNSSAGNYVRIRVDSRTIMVYYHLKSKSTLKAGEKVKTGEKLGYMGSTGSATGAHLHFGIQQDGKWIDPEPWLDKDWVPSDAPTKYVSIQVPVLKRGMKGTQVENMQKILIAKGYKMISADGKIDYGADGSFGATTERVLTQYQKDHSLDPDGCCGPATWTSFVNDPA